MLLRVLPQFLEIPALFSILCCSRKGSNVVKGANGLSQSLGIENCLVVSNQFRQDALKRNISHENKQNRWNGTCIVLAHLHSLCLDRHAAFPTAGMIN